MRAMLQSLAVASFLVVAGCGHQCDGGGDGTSFPALSLEDGGPPAASIAGGASGESIIGFGRVTAGNESDAAIVLTNTGVAPLQVLTVGAASDTEFSLTLPVGTIVGPGSETFIPISFKPFNEGGKSATATIETDSQATPTVTLNFTGTGEN